MPDPDFVKVIDSNVTRKPLALVKGVGSAFAVLWPENGAHFRTFNLIEMAAGDVTRDLCHASECIYYIRDGNGLIRDLGDSTAQDLVEGSMIHIGVGDSYRIEAEDSGMYLIGGTAPVDPAFYELAAEEPAQ